jgi:alpha-tubulin suppressor-like RCC1 family protein
MTCAVLADGALYCWGADYTGRFGKGAASDGGTSIAPVRVDAANTYQRVTLDDYVVCGVLAGGSRARCWGSNAQQMLGRNDPAPGPLAPGDVTTPGLSITAIAAGVAHTCTVTTSGVSGWGSNRDGQLGNTANPVPTGTPIAGFEGAVGVGAGIANTCAVFASGTVSCVGTQSLFGETPVVGGIKTPRVITGLSDAKQVAVGDAFACALRAGGGSAGKPSVACWGKNNRGQLGDGTTNVATTPVQVKLP